MMIQHHEVEYALNNTDGFGAGESRKAIRGYQFWTFEETSMTITKTVDNSKFLSDPKIKSERSNCEWRYDLKA